MTKNVRIPFWAKWLPWAVSSAAITDAGISLSSRHGAQFFEWDALEVPPQRAPIWFLHMVSLSTSGGTRRLYFATAKQRDLAFGQLSQGWYARSVAQLTEKLQMVEGQLAIDQYLRTSRWKGIEEEIQSWKAILPPLPDQGALPAASYAVIDKTIKLANDPGARLVKERERYVNGALVRYHDLFDTVESDPLTKNQRVACIVDEDNNLILAGAGTGKTSTVIGRVAFLVKSGQAKPEEILLLAYGREAAKEMRERLEQKLGVKGIRAATFHALGRCIVEAVEGKPAELSLMANDSECKVNFINSVFEQEQKKPEYLKLLLHYFEHWLHPARNPFDFKTLGEYYRYLEDNNIRTLKGEPVKGFGECEIANFLFMNGIEYDYEAKYHTPLQAPDRKIYSPDFFLRKDKIYIEHFGIDRNGDTASYIDRTKYHADIAWKRSVHTQGNTTLIETYHYEKQEGNLLELLKQKLTAAGVAFNPLPAEAVLETLRKFGAVNEFAKILRSMLGLIRGANLSPEALEDVIARADHPEQIRAALTLLAPIKAAYEDELEATGTVDYDDMINKGWQYLKSDEFESPWKFIIVDEFQDISKARADMVLALKQKRDDVSLFCVGDDWQSIYRFTGSDIGFTAEFEKRFGPTASNDLDKTFRFNSKIGEVASDFVMKNKRQLVKNIKSHQVVDAPTVSLAMVPLHSEVARYQAVDRITQRIAEIAPPGSSVYFLARFKSELPDLKDLAMRYPGFTFKTDSIHASKGKEADYVVVLGVVKGEYGLPSEKVSHPLVEALLPVAEEYPYAEERRLFYVALTRAKHRVYLMTDMQKCSPFVAELIKGQYPIDLEELPACADQRLVTVATCPTCVEGNLMTRKNGETGQSFIGCTNYPRCKHTEPSCPECNSLLQPFDRDYKVCSKAGCTGWIAMCPSSPGYMVYRKALGKWGCSDYRKGSAYSCGHKMTHIDPPERSG